MLLAVLIVLVACSLGQIPYMCREIRLETKQEAERRKTYEYCTAVCNEAESSTVPCSKCQIPYEDYGCLWQRNEVKLNCAMECELLLPNQLAQLQCVENCGIAKALNIL